RLDQHRAPDPQHVVEGEQPLLWRVGRGVAGLGREREADGGTEDVAMGVAGIGRQHDVGPFRIGMEGQLGSFHRLVRRQEKYSSRALSPMILRRASGSSTASQNQSMVLW